MASNEDIQNEQEMLDLERRKKLDYIEFHHSREFVASKFYPCFTKEMIFIISNIRRRGKGRDLKGDKNGREYDTEKEGKNRRRLRNKR